ETRAHSDVSGNLPIRPLRVVSRCRVFRPCDQRAESTTGGFDSTLLDAVDSSGQGVRGVGGRGGDDLTASVQETDGQRSALHRTESARVMVSEQLRLFEAPRRRVKLTCAFGTDWSAHEHCAGCAAFVEEGIRQFNEAVAAGMYDDEGYTPNER